MSSLSSNLKDTKHDDSSISPPPPPPPPTGKSSPLKNDMMMHPAPAPAPASALKNKIDHNDHTDLNGHQAKELKVEPDAAADVGGRRASLKKQPSTTNLMRERNPSFKSVRAVDLERGASLSDDCMSSSAKSTQQVPKLITQYSHDSGAAKKRTRTMYAPVQQSTYGPKATLKKVTEDYLVLIQDPLSQQLSWTKPPLFVLVIKKLCNTLFEPFVNIIKYLVFNHNMIVYVEESEFDLMKTDEQIKHLVSPTSSTRKYSKPSLRKFEPPASLAKQAGVSAPTSSSELTQSSTKLSQAAATTENHANKIDLIVCLGGDGTLLHASTLFQKSCPPVLSLNMGSLGFLCPFDFENYREYIDGVIKGNVPLLLRNRLCCKLEKTPELLAENSFTIADPTQSSPTLIASAAAAVDTSASAASESSPVTNEWLSLNEVVVDRGPSPFLSNLDLYVNDFLITTVQGDGLIISSPTGSTAYAMAAGASMCHPSVPSIIIVPICPHSLSFRPIVVPAGVELRIALSSDSRHTAWYSIDGRNSGELKKGYHLTITTSIYPLPSICRSDQMNDWFEGLGMCLHWNQRQKQLPLNSCYLTNNAPQLNSSSLSNSKSSSTSSLQHIATNGGSSTDSSTSSSSSSSSSSSTTNQNETTNTSDNTLLKVQSSSKLSREPSVEFHLNDEEVPKRSSRLRIPSSSNLVAREATK